MPRLDPPARSSFAEQKPFCETIGKLVFAFGHLEKQIDWCISVLLDADCDQNSPTVASQIHNICSRIALVEALFRRLTVDEHERAALHGLLKDVQAVLKFRNGVLHGPWGYYDAGSRTWRKPRTSAIDLVPWQFEVSEAGLREHIQRSQDIGDGLVALVGRVVETGVVVTPNLP